MTSQSSFQGGLGEDGELSNVALTAYVVTSLIEGGVTVPSRVLRNSLACLRALPPLKSKAPARFAILLTLFCYLLGQ